MREVPLSQGKTAIVSDEDFERVSRFKWTAHKGSSSGSRYYAVRNAVVYTEIAPGVRESRRVWIRMHRFIADLPPGTISPDLVVDHKNGDGLDNRRENLEVVTFSENYRRAAEKKRKPVEPFL